MLTLESWMPLLLTAGAFFSLFGILGRSSKIARVCASVLCIALAARYLYWRYTESLPATHGILSTLWIWIFLLFETSAVLSSSLVQTFMARHKNRSSIADERQNSPLLQAPVDVFIATYNEGREILERTIIGALAIQHPDLRVWVLDDGARPEVKELAENLGAHYAYRRNGKHAKAGNVNHGLQQALQTGRRPQFLLLLDADFVPNRNILQRTLGLFEDQDVGIVQTPQHFFNPDPLQSNLFCSSVWPDEQRFFFNYLLPCKDAWGAAFCCGTSAVFRIEALVACGGMATETVTEDMLTTFRMQEHGYRTIYLNEPLSMGLSPEGIREYLSQRSRWCLGAIQQIYTRWSFFGSAKLPLIQRISFFDGVLFWVSSAVFKLLMMSAPLVYWLTGATVIETTGTDLLCMLAPMVLANLLFMSIMAKNRILPVITDISQLISAFVICGTVVTGLVRPFGHPFKVTAKGASSQSRIVHWKLLAPFFLMACATLAAMLFHLSRFTYLNGGPGYSLNIFWSLFNSFILFSVAAAYVELPRRRLHERFPWEIVTTALMDDGRIIYCAVDNISLGGAHLQLEDEIEEKVKKGLLLLPNEGTRLPFDITRRESSYIAISFDTDSLTYRKLIVKLFTGEFNNEVGNISLVRVLLSVCKALFA